MLKKLSDSLVAKIAAGEVIERPFSVVKELVENSIDAGAHDILIELDHGGRRRILIVDDGCGMTCDEALLSLERHATSKISSEEDLFNIQTLGFRGEALPSIAAISQMTLETCAAGESLGTRLDIEGGKVVKVGTSSLRKGTRICVENLFFNTPARLKFLKTKETEFSHSANWLESIALSRPDVGFRLVHEGKKEMTTQALLKEDLRGRIGEVLGSTISEFLHPVLLERHRMKLTGFISDHRAGAASAASKSLFFFVNGRSVRDRILQHAVLSAYENLLMKHRYPWVVLTLQVPPDFVDVNVHPTKNEVRFAQTNLVHELVREGVRGALGVGAPLGAPLPHFDVGAGFPRPQSDEIEQGAEIALLQRTSDIRIIGQAHQTYLVCETAEKLFLIDQHAAHERIGFEKLKRQHEEGGIQRQQLLIPQNFDLRPSQAAILKKYLSELNQVGLEIEFFGGATFILRSIPILLQGSDFVALIEELLEDLQSFEKLSPLSDRVHEVLERMACHQQVRAGDHLNREEIEELLHQMNETPFAGQCPHGRPAILEIPFTEVEKWFKRRL